MEPKRSSRRGALLWFAAALAVLATALWLRLRGNTTISGPGTPGRYKAEAQGYGGPVEVQLVVNKRGGIQQLTVLADRETPEIGQAAAPQVAASIVAAQSWQVDDVSGATRTSRAVRTLWQRLDGRLRDPPPCARTKKGRPAGLPFLYGFISLEKRCQHRAPTKRPPAQK